MFKRDFYEDKLIKNAIYTTFVLSHGRLVNLIVFFKFCNFLLYVSVRFKVKFTKI